MIGTIEHVHVVPGGLEGQVRLNERDYLNLALVDELRQKMMLRNAVALLKRIVDARVLHHGGPEGLERDARRIVQWYTDLPADQKDMALDLGVDLAEGPDHTVVIRGLDTRQS